MTVRDSPLREGAFLRLCLYSYRAWGPSFALAVNVALGTTAVGLFRHECEGLERPSSTPNGGGESEHLLWDTAGMMTGEASLE
jgi:hypothetical protein